MAYTSSFIFSTELVALLIGGLIHFFARTNRPKVTAEYRILFFGITTLMTELLFEFFLDLYVQFHTNHLYVWMVNILCVLIWVSHVMVITALLVYIYRLSGVELNIGSLNKGLTIISFLYIGFGVYLLNKGNMYTISNHQFMLSYMFAYIEFLCLISTVIFYINALMIRRNFPRPLFNYVRTFVPLIIFLQVLQIFYYKVVFAGIIYMVPFMVLYFLYHNHPYNVLTGEREKDALGGYFQLIFDKNLPFDFIDLKLDVMGSEKSERKKAFFNDYWRVCRECEYLDKSIFFFKYGPKETIILFSISDEKKRAETKQKIRELLENLNETYSDISAMIVFATHENNGIETIEEGAAYIEYLYDQYIPRSSFDWNEVADETSQHFKEYYLVKQALIDIDLKCKLDDPRVLCYAQPIYEVESGKFKTAEALMRLKLGDEMIRPDIFIPIAEANNVIHSISKIMLNKVCEFIAKNQDEYDIEAVSFNCCMAEMAIPSCANEFIEIIKNNNISCSKIRMEITESNSIDGKLQMEIAVKNILKLKAAGIVFYLDDYGTGYSNLSRVLSMEMHTVKFDKSIFYKALAESQTEEIISTMIKAFKEKSAHALVEGVETEEQAEFAINHGFEYIQGFLYAKPEPIENFVHYLSKR